MNVNKISLAFMFQREDWERLFEQAYEVADYVLTTLFDIWPQHMNYEDYKQEMLGGLWVKIVDGKIPLLNKKNQKKWHKNMLSLMIGSFRWTMKDMRVKEVRRSKIMPFESYEEIVETKGDKYVKKISR